MEHNVYFVVACDKASQTHILRELKRTDAQEAQNAFKKLQEAKRKLNMTKLKRGDKEQVNMYKETVRPLEDKYLGIIYTKSTTDMFFNIRLCCDVSDIIEKVSTEDALKRASKN